MSGGNGRINPGADFIGNDANLWSIFGWEGADPTKDFGDGTALAKK